MSMSSSSSCTVGTTSSQTASTIVAEVVTGSHVLTIDGYSRTKGLGNGKFVRSGTFNIGGHDWYIRYYPDGDDSNNADWISLYLQFTHTDPKGVVKVTFSISLFNQFGKDAPLYNKSGETRSFTATDYSWGFARFIEKKALEESAYLKDDCFRIKCEVMVINEIRTVATTATQLVALPPSDIQRHLGCLLLTGDGSDVTFQVGGEMFPAHRCVLAARSSVFKAELFGAMKENIADHVQIDDMEASVFKALLHFIYTDAMPDDMEEANAAVMFQHLFVAADRYNMERLKLICEDKLCCYIDTSTVVTTLVLAEQHGCHGLKEACFRFFKSPGKLKAVMASDGFLHLKSSCPSLLEELVAKLAP